MTVEGSRQLNFPGSKDLYKIISIQKQGFSLTLINLRTQATLTVVHSRVSHLSLDNLLYFDIAMPDLYDKLIALTIKNWRTFRQGTSQKPLKLMTEDDLTNDDTGLGQEDDHSDEQEEILEEDLEGPPEMMVY